MKRQPPRNVILFLSVVSLSLLIGGTWFETHAQPQDDVSVARQLVGTWRLVSWTSRLSDGTTKQEPWRVGYLIYSSGNRMCATLMDPDRPKWKSDTSPTPEEAKSSMNGFIAYCSKVEVHAAEGFVLHYVEIAQSPNLIGRNRRRGFKFDGPNRLILQIDKSELPSRVVESALIWDRVEDGSR